MRLKAGVNLVRSREEIIIEALLIHIDTGVIRADFFSSMEVLTVAKVGEDEIKKLKVLYCERVDMKELLKTISM